MTPVERKRNEVWEKIKAKVDLKKRVEELDQLIEELEEKEKKGIQKIQLIPG
jgi:hypothetical protein